MDQSDTTTMKVRTATSDDLSTHQTQAKDENKDEVTSEKSPELPER